MNDTIKKELDKLIDINLIKDYDTNIFIPKSNTISLEVGNYYIIELSDALLNNITYSYLTTNLNNNSYPTNKYYKINVIQILDNKVRFVGIAYDINNDMTLDSKWTGWIPTKEIKVLRKL